MNEHEARELRDEVDAYLKSKPYLAKPETNVQQNDDGTYYVQAWEAEERGEWRFSSRAEWSSFLIGEVAELEARLINKTAEFDARLRPYEKPRLEDLGLHLVESIDDIITNIERDKEDRLLRRIENYAHFLRMYRRAKDALIAFTEPDDDEDLPF